MKNMNYRTIVTATCPNCGVNLSCSSIAPATKCHWCHTLIPASLYIENHSMPEQILPFKIEKEEAKKIIDEYMKKRNKYASKKFLANYKSDNIVPVYLPYMIVDINLHSENKGVTTNYRLYQSVTDKEYLNREFDMTIENALIEASKSNYFNSINSTSNVISSVVPFDIENAVEFDANYLNGYLSESRELNVDLLKTQINKIVENNTNKFLDEEMKKHFEKIDVGYNDTYWYQQKNSIIGSQWVSIFLPVWIYSYCEKVDDINKIYYIAVNGRTGKIVGSLPIDNKKVKKLKINIYILLSILSIIFVITCYLLLEYQTREFYEAEKYFAYTIGSFLLGFIILELVFFYQDCVDKIINKINKKYIHNKSNDNTENTKVNVYNRKYKETYNRKGAL